MRFSCVCITSTSASTGIMRACHPAFGQGAGKLVGHVPSVPFCLLVGIPGSFHRRRPGALGCDFIFCTHSLYSCCGRVLGSCVVVCRGSVWSCARVLCGRVLGSANEIRTTLIDLSDMNLFAQSSEARNSG